MPPARSVEERFLALVDRSADHGWAWTGSLGQAGWGRMRIDGKLVPAHVVSHWLWIGPVPEGFDVVQLCRRRECVDPVCLEAMSRPDARRRRRRRRSHCHAGLHPMTGANLLVDKTGRARCRECTRRSNRRSYNRRKGTTDGS